MYYTQPQEPLPWGDCFPSRVGVGLSQCYEMQQHEPASGMNSIMSEASLGVWIGIAVRIPCQKLRAKRALDVGAIARRYP